MTLSAAVDRKAVPNSPSGEIQEIELGLGVLLKVSIDPWQLQVIARRGQKRRRSLAGEEEEEEGALDREEEEEEEEEEEIVRTVLSER